MSRENILAIPSRGKFQEETLQLLNCSGIQIAFSGRKLTAEGHIPECGAFTVALQRPKDIVQIISNREKLPTWLGIVGMDTVDEYLSARTGSFRKNPIEILLKLGIGHCRLALSALNGKMTPLGDTDPAQFLSQFNNKTIIATSYPNLTRQHIKRIATDAHVTPPKIKIRYMTGALEAAPAMGLATVISDLVETGKSLEDNGLEELATLFRSEGVLVARSSHPNTPFIEAIKSRLQHALTAR